MDFVHQQIVERGKHGRVAARTDRAALEVSETKMGREPATTVDRVHRAIENIDEPLRVFAVRIATHGRFIDANLLAACSDQCHEFIADNGEQCFGEPVTIVIALVRNQPATQGVRPWHAGLQHG